MSKIKRNRVIGARGILVHNASLNNAFDGNPKMLSDGTFTNSDVSTKFADRQFWNNAGKEVLIQKHIKLDKDGNPYAATLEEIIKDKVPQDKDINTNLYILDKFVDVQNFGATIAVKGISLGTTGVVQYGQGINKIEDSAVITQEITSPYGTGANANKKAKKKSEEDEEDKLSTGTNIGKQVYTDKALYVQSFNVTPANLNNMADVFGDSFGGYKEESYEMFKKATLCSVSLLNSRAKMGCSDAFAIFINLKEGSLYALNDVERYIKITEDNGVYTIDCTELEFLNDSSEVESIEVFYDIRTCNLKHSFKNAVVKDILAGI